MSINRVSGVHQGDAVEDMVMTETRRTTQLVTRIMPEKRKRSGWSASRTVSGQVDDKRRSPSIKLKKSGNGYASIETLQTVSNARSLLQVY